MTTEAVTLSAQELVQKANDRIHEWLMARVDTDAVDIARLYLHSRDRLLQRLRALYDTYLAEEPSYVKARTTGVIHAINRLIDQDIQQLTDEVGQVAVSNMAGTLGQQYGIAEKALTKHLPGEFSDLRPSTRGVLNELTTHIVGGATFYDRLFHINDGLKRELVGGIRQGLINGEDFLQTRQRLLKAFGVEKLRKPAGPAYGSVKTYKNEARRQWNLLMQQQAQSSDGIQVWWAVLDPDTTPGCLARHATPIGQAGMIPPRHINCVLPGTVVRGSIRKIVRMDYDGPVVRLRTRRGNQLSLTPNHPVLTTRGFVFAGELDKGDNLLYSTFDRESAPGIADEQDAPPTVDQLMDTMLQHSPTVRRPVICDDFYGDGVFGQGNVDVVAIDPMLMNDRQFSFSKLCCNGEFKMSSSTGQPKASFGQSSLFIPPWWVGLAASSRPGRGTLTPENGLIISSASSLVPFEQLCLLATPQFDTSFTKTIREYRARKTTPFTQCQERHTICVQLQKPRDLSPNWMLEKSTSNGHSLCMPDHQRMLFGEECHGFSLTTNDLMFLENLVYDLSGSAKLARHFIDRAAGAIECDELVEIERFHHSGSVYDVETSTGLVLAENYITKQCRCTIAVFPRGTNFTPYQQQALAMLEKQGYTKKQAMLEESEHPGYGWGHRTLQPLVHIGGIVESSGMQFATVPWRELPYVAVSRTAVWGPLASVCAVDRPDHVLLRRTHGEPEVKTWEGWVPVFPRTRLIETLRGVADDSAVIQAPWDERVQLLPAEVRARWPGLARVTVPVLASYALALVDRKMAEQLTLGTIDPGEGVPYQVSEDFPALAMHVFWRQGHPGDTQLVLASGHDLQPLLIVDVATGATLYAAESFASTLLAPYTRVAAAILESHGRIWAILPRGHPAWVLPGGHLEPEERPLDALVREIREETGLPITPLRLLGKLYRPWSTTLVYLARRTGGQGEPTTPEEIDGVHCIQFEDLAADERAFLSRHGVTAKWDDA